MTQKIVEEEWVDETTGYICNVSKVDFEFTKEMKLFYNMEGEHRCGYVTFPTEIANTIDMYDLDVHGGITWSEDNEDGTSTWGFDCAHYGDSIKQWDFNAVKAEVLNLVRQLAHYELDT